MTQQQSNLKRRGFLQATLRCGVALGAVVGGFALSKRNGIRAGQNACLDPQGRTGCGSCSLLGSCGLPRGLSFKQVRGGLDNDC